MKVVWSPPIFTPPTDPPYYKNIWFIPSNHEAWLEPNRYKSVAEAMESAESADCIRIAIIELVD